jgi:hypothetical protein
VRVLGIDERTGKRRQGNAGQRSGLQDRRQPQDNDGGDGQGGHTQKITYEITGHGQLLRVAYLFSFSERFVKNILRTF